MSRVLVIDNYDSFTFNLVQILRAQGASVVVHRNDTLTVAQAEALEPTHLVISPGPGRPREAGQSLRILNGLMDRVPTLGVCLGHQCIVQALGGTIVHAPALRHGKPSPVIHDDQGLFAGLPNPLVAGRYHSLVADEGTLPACLDVCARTDDGVVMAVRHRHYPVVGVQFHPESVLTPDGEHLLANFLGQCGAPTRARGEAA